MIRKGGIGFISLKEKKEMDEGIVRQQTTGIERYFSYYTKGEFDRS